MVPFLYSLVIFISNWHFVSADPPKPLAGFSGWEVKKQVGMFCKRSLVWSWAMGHSEQPKNGEGWSPRGNQKPPSFPSVQQIPVYLWGDMQGCLDADLKNPT